MKNKIITISIVFVLFLIIALVIVANFKVAPFVTNIEINDSKRFNDKVIVNVYVDNYFFKLNKETWCIVTNKKDEVVTKNDSRWTKANNGYCSYTTDAGDYNIYVKDKYGNINDIYSQKVEINKILEAKFNKEAVYLYKGGKEKIDYDLVVLGNSKDEVKVVSSNEDIIEISNGIVTGKNYGVAEIQIKDDNYIYGRLKVYVSNLITKPKINFDKPYIKCKQFSEEEANLIDKMLEDRINSAGYATRAAVLAAARFATLEFAYRIDYFYENGRLKNYAPFPKVDGEGRYYHKGMYLSESKFKDIEVSYVGPAIWGCDLQNFTNWGKWVRYKYYPNGLDCSGFVSWILYNAGFDVGDIGAGGDGSGQKSLPDLGTKLSISKELMNSGRVKPGDLIGLEGHAAILAGWDENNYYIAESLNGTGGVVMTTVAKKKLESRNSIYTFVVLMDNVYKQDGNVTTYWE